MNQRTLDTKKWHPRNPSNFQKRLKTSAVVKGTRSRAFEDLMWGRCPDCLGPLRRMESPDRLICKDVRCGLELEVNTRRLRPRLILYRTLGSIPLGTAMK
jgi:hypothetical protein